MARHRNHAPEVNINLNVRGLTVSPTLAIQELSDQLRREGREIFRLGLGQSPFPVPRPVIEALQVNAYQKDYLPVKGLPLLREAVAEYYRRRHHLPSTGDDVIIGPGSKELLFLLQIVYYGELVVPSPGWVSYVPQAQIVGRTVRWVQTRADHHWKLMPDEFAALLRSDPFRPRIIIINYPNNPTGGTYTADDLRALARIAREHKILVLSDEIYGELHFKGQHVSIARFYPEGTIISGGLSKWCGAGGWRLGAFCFPKELRWLLDAMAVVASETYTSTSAPIQYAAVRAFRGGNRIESYLWNSRRLLRELARTMVRGLESCGLRVVPPAGAFYVFPDFVEHRDRLAGRGIVTSDDLCRRLLADTGVAMLPGTAFGRPPEELTVRIAYVDFDGARALSAVEHMGPEGVIDAEFLGLYCANVLEALNRLAGWLSD